MALPRKTFQGTTFTIDRPKGTVKAWPKPDGGEVRFVYPCDYGSFPRLKGEDGEGLDAFVGDDPAGHYEAFQKLKPRDGGGMELDETKFLVGVSDAEREAIYRFYGDMAHARRVFRDMAHLRDALKEFEPKKKERHVKTADDTLSEAERQRRFQRYAALLRRKGVYAGTSHKRVVIPKTHLDEQDLRALGFERVMAAIPEAGQDSFYSYRHPSNLFHLHSHPGRWTMHEDEYPSATMLAKRYGPWKAFVLGMPHVVTEGVPGFVNYLGGLLAGRKSTADAVEKEMRLSSSSPAVKTAETLPRKTFQGTTFIIDRPKGTVKAWPKPDGGEVRFVTRSLDGWARHFADRIKRAALAERGLVAAARKEAALKTVLARYKLSDLKRADIDKLIRGHVVAMPNTGRQTPAEEASIADRLTRVFDRADAKTQPTGEESSIGQTPLEYLKTASPELVQRAFPALSAAFDAYSAVRDQERQAALARQFSAFPGLMAEYTMPNQGMTPNTNLGQVSATPSGHHHRRHRHHSG